jgi:hypothetical protein
MVAFIDAHRGVSGVEPICAVRPIAPSTSYAHRARAADPTRRSARAVRDAQLRPEIERVWAATRRRYGARKAWVQLNREAVSFPVKQTSRNWTGGVWLASAGR